MPDYSCFTPYGQLEYSSDPSDAEKIYESMRASYTHPKTGVPTIDMTPGTYHEAKIYARAMAIADAAAAVKRAENQSKPREAVESIPHFEKIYRLAPPPNATLDQRRAKVVRRYRAPRGNRREALYDELGFIFGAALIAVRALKDSEATIWPASPGTGPGVFTRPEQPSKVVRLLDPVVKTGSASTIYYENWDTKQPALQLAKGDILSVQPENFGLAEKVTITSVAGTGSSRTLTATFSKSHDQNASATTGPAPIWWSDLGHIFVVVTAAAALDAALVAQANELLARVLKAGTTWSIVSPTTPGAATVGPFTLGTSPLGTVSVGQFTI